MTKKEECYKIFADNEGATREHTIDLVIKNVGVTKTTAQTYYPTWRKEFIYKPSYADLNNKEDLKFKVIEKPNKVAEAVESKTEKPTELNIEKIVSQAFAENRNKLVESSEKIISETKKNALDDEGIKRKEEVMKPIKDIEVVDENELFEVTKLIPVVMRGKHGRYFFDKDGVKATLNEDFISKEKMEEAQEALKIWEQCYKKEEVIAYQ